MLALVVLLWGFGYTANRYSVTHGWEPLALPALRVAIATVLFTGIALWREGTIRIERRDVPRVLAAALLFGVCNQAAFHYSVKFASASTVALVFGTLPVFAALVTHFSGHEVLRRRHWTATAVSFGGVALVAAGAGGALTGSLGGVLLALAAAVTFATYSVIMSTISSRYSPWRISAIVTLVGVGPLLAMASPQLASQDFGALGGLAWGAALYTLAMFTGTAVLWYLAIERVGAAHATLWVNLQPFAGVVFGVLVLSESLQALQIAGAVVIASSIVLSRWRRPAAPAPPP
jgi:drug/metabolite transporter (DMT)-like permease